MRRRYLNPIQFIVMLSFAFGLAALPKAMCGPVLEGKVAEKIWTVDDARQEAFRQVKPWILLKRLPARDPHFEENRRAIAKQQKTVANRTLTIFSKGGYAVSEGSATQGYYYDRKGRLRAVDFHVGQGRFPFKTLKYSYPGGELTTVFLHVAPSDTYAFSAAGALIGHWLEEYNYDLNGNIVGGRYSVKY